MRDPVFCELFPELLVRPEPEPVVLDVVDVGDDTRRVPPQQKPKLVRKRSAAAAVEQRVNKKPATDEPEVIVIS